MNEKERVKRRLILETITKGKFGGFEAVLKMFRVQSGFHSKYYGWFFKKLSSRDFKILLTNSSYYMRGVTMGSREEKITISRRLGPYIEVEETWKNNELVSIEWTREEPQPLYDVGIPNYRVMGFGL